MASEITYRIETKKSPYLTVIMILCAIWMKPVAKKLCRIIKDVPIVKWRTVTNEVCGEWKSDVLFGDWLV